MYEREIFADEWEPLDDMPEHRVESIRRQREFYQRLKAKQKEFQEQGRGDEFVKAIPQAMSGWVTERPRYKD